MTIRRRLFVATLTVGVGICCFQPVMRSRMERRLSELLGGQVAIGSSQISLRDSTIALSDIVIQPFRRQVSNGNETERTPIKIGQAALKFSWSGLLYRNFKVESFLASDVRWEISEPSKRAVPAAIEAGDISFLTQESEKNAPSARVESVVQPIKAKLSHESVAQTQSQQKISLQLKAIAQRLGEVLSTDGSLNVLRQRSIVEDSRKEIASMKQSIAEDKLAHKKAEKAFNALKLLAQEQLASKTSLEPELDRKRSKQAAEVLAKLAIAQEWNACRPIVHATVASLQSLKDPIQAELDSVDAQRVDSKLQMDNQTQTASLLNLPVGFTHLSAGKMDGSLDVPNGSLPGYKAFEGSRFVFQFWNLSSRPILNLRNAMDAPKPTVTLRLNSDATHEASVWMTCTAQQIVLPQSDISQIQLTLDKKNALLGQSSTKIQHANQGWSGTIAMPTQCCLELPMAKTLAIDRLTSSEASPKKTRFIVGKLMGKTVTDPAAQNALWIEVDPTSLTELEEILSTWHSSELEKKRLQASRRASELLNNELLSLNTRWEQLGDEHIRAHENWTASMAELDTQLKALSAVFQRTSRSASTTVQ